MDSGASPPGIASGRKHAASLLLFALAALLDGAFGSLQLEAMLTGPASRGNVYPGGIVALALTAPVTATAVAGFAAEWRRAIETRRLLRLALACIALPALLLVAALVVGP